MWFISAIVLLAAGSAYGENGPPPDCALDICFLVDSTSSIGRPNWNAFVIPFLHNIVDALYGPPGIDARVGIQLFAATAPAASLELTDIHEGNNLNDIIHPTITNLPFLKGLTDIAAGLLACKENVFNGSNPDRQQMIVLISDGVPTINKASTIPVANACKQDGVEIISVAVGTFSLDILTNISSNGVVIQVNNFNALATLLGNLYLAILAACDDVPPTPTPTPTPVITPPTASPICPNCSGDWIPEPTYTWSHLDPIEMQWFPLSQFTKPDPDIPDPDELFELEEYVLYYSTYVWYVGFVPPVYPVATTTRTPLPPP